jgi:hypothetical protein
MRDRLETQEIFNSVCKEPRDSYETQHELHEVKYEMTQNDINLGYKHSTCLGNSNFTVKSNLFINLKCFNKLVHGKLTKSLPGVRFTVNINNQRYTLIIFSTGKINVTNMFYLNDMQHVYIFIINLYLFLLYINIAHFNKFGHKNIAFYDENLDSVVYPYSNRKLCTNIDEELHVEFLLENFQFSIQINEFYFRSKFKSTQDLYLFITDKLKKVIKNSEFFTKEEISFPANLFKIIFSRKQTKSLNRLKSNASKKRKKNNFSTHKLAVLLFDNGKLTITGGQTIEDTKNIKILLESILYYFFN